MSCVILIASIVPCRDAAAFNQTEMTVVKAASNHNCNGSTDDCSPLCICSCCAGSSVYYSSPQVVKYVYQITADYPDFIAADIHQVAIPVWQPPQL